MKKAYIFPGQGGQSVGMGAGLPRDAFDEVDNALGYKLSDIIFNGPEEELNRAVNLQPAIFAVSMAIWRNAGDAAGASATKVASAAVKGKADGKLPLGAKGATPPQGGGDRALQGMGDRGICGLTGGGASC